LLGLFLAENFVDVLHEFPPLGNVRSRTNPVNGTSSPAGYGSNLRLPLNGTSPRLLLKNELLVTHPRSVRPAKSSSRYRSTVDSPTLMDAFAAYSLRTRLKSLK